VRTVIAAAPEESTAPCPTRTGPRGVRRSTWTRSPTTVPCVLTWIVVVAPTSADAESTGTIRTTQVALLTPASAFQRNFADAVIAGVVAETVPVLSEVVRTTARQCRGPRTWSTVGWSGSRAPESSVTEPVKVIVWPSGTRCAGALRVIAEAEPPAPAVDVGPADAPAEGDGSPGFPGWVPEVAGPPVGVLPGVAGAVPEAVSGDVADGALDEADGGATGAPWEAGDLLHGVGEGAGVRRGHAAGDRHGDHDRRTSRAEPAGPAGERADA
jgi:hypothetical protein